MESGGMEEVVKDQEKNELLQTPTMEDSGLEESARNEKKTELLHGCIKGTQGPWIVHRATKDGLLVTSYRFPSVTERQKNMARERKRRSVARRIFAGLREHGNYKLPKHADSNDLLKALCMEAGWLVGDDGTVYGKVPRMGDTSETSVVEKDIDLRLSL